MAFGIGRLLGRTVMGRSGLDGVERVLASIGRGPVQITPGRCTRARHRLSTCSACRDVCRSTAIEMPGPTEAAPPRVDAQKCSGCGLCVPACPTEAIGSDRRPLPKPGSGGQSVACQPAAEQGIPADTVVPCLGAVDPAFWLEGAGRRLTIYRGACDTCPIEGGGAVMDRNLAEAQAIASLGGDELDIRIEDVAVRTPATRAPMGEARVSRRDFFRLAVREARADVLAAVLPEPSGQVWRGGHLHGEPSLRRRTIAAYLPDEVAEGGAGCAQLPMWQVEMEHSRCTGCGLCVEACPEAALSWSEPRPGHSEGGIATALVFESALCDGCRLCADVCPHRAVNLRRASAPWQKRPQVLLGGQRRACERCGETFFATNGENVCQRCARRAEAVVHAVLGRQRGTADRDT